MKLYDDLISKIHDLMDVEGSREYPVCTCDWKEVSDRSMILRSDMAFELGGEHEPSIGCTLITTDESLVSENKITLLGPDLHEITAKGNVPYARVAIVRVSKDAIGEGDALYNAIRKLEYTRYHFYPEGFMMRVSSAKNKESVRIGREAVDKGLGFAIVGNKMIEAFQNNPLVEAVEIKYVTMQDFDFKALEKMTENAEAITKTIDHIFKNVKMDCNTCNLQEICDEVEGLRELHFATGTNA